MHKGDERLSGTEPCFLECTRDGMVYWRLVRRRENISVFPGADNQIFSECHKWEGNEQMLNNQDMEL